MIPGNGVGGTVGGAPRDRLARRLGRLRGAGRGGGRRAVRRPRRAARSTTRSRCSPTAARRRCWPSAAAVAPGERVLVEAAAGGVGTLLVQLAPAAGAHVVAAAGSERQARARRARSAREAVDYTRDGWAVGPFDVVFDGVGGDDRARGVRAARAAAGGCSATASPAATWAGIAPEEAAARGRHARPARPRPAGAAQLHRARAAPRDLTADHRPALPAGTRRRRARRDRSAARQQERHFSRSADSYARATMPVPHLPTALVPPADRARRPPAPARSGPTSSTRSRSRPSTPTAPATAARCTRRTSGRCPRSPRARCSPACPPAR